tara:strand:- start:2514 stop:4760 length:2247 start_codon:yes stop_codon:yes gene_type:complete
MSQVNFLSADVGQTPDKQGAKGDASIKNQAKTQAFSDAMEQHYPSKTVAESDNKNKQGGNLTSKAADQQQQFISKDGALKQVKENQADDAHILPLPANDESLSAKNENSQNSSMPFPIDNESPLATDKTVNDDVDTLPLPIDDKSLVTSPKESDGFIVPITVAANGEQLITSNKSKDSEHTLPVPLPVSPSEAKIRVIEKAGGAFNGDPKAPNNQSNLYIGSQTQTVNNTVSNVEKDDAVDLLKMLQGSQQLLTKSAVENTRIEQQGKNTAPVDEALLANNKNVALSEQPKKLTAEQNDLVKSMKGEQVQVLAKANVSQQAQLLADSQTAAANTAGNLVEKVANNTVKSSTESVTETIVTSNAKQITSNAESANTLASKQGIVNDVDLIAEQARTQALAQEANSAIDKNQDTKQVTHQVTNNRELQSSAADKDSAFDLAQAKKVAAPELIAEQNTAHKGIIASESHEAKVQTAELKQANVADFKRAIDNEPAQTRTINQSTAAVISASTAESKLDVNQKPAENEAVDKLASVKGDEKLAKAESDKLAPQVDKITSAFNQTLDAMATKPMASSAELAAQQAQNFESTINHLTTTTVQTQKSITAMNTETIAIYRKDFADAVKDKVMVMINQKIQQVDIQLDPPEMGNIHVRVNLQNEQAAVQFVVQNQQAKEALEQNMGKLRDMLAESGVDVGDANIEQRQAKEQNGNDFEQHDNNGQNGESTEDNVSANDNSMHNVVKASSTGVDYYA